MSESAELTTSSLLDIPEDVFLEGLFPLLSVNCLLGLRRACRRTKCLSEDYLQSGPRSRNQICLNVGPESVEMPGRKSLKKFLQEDNVCSIRNPSSHFQLAYTDPDVLGIPRVFTFLQKYAKHVVHLKIFHLTLPLTEHEMMFFVKLENLRSLKVTWLIGREHDESVRKIPFPESFKNLKSLKIDQWGDTLGPGSCSTLRKGDLLLQLVQHCKKLVYFRDPNRLPGVERFMIMSKILDDGEHKKLQFYDMMQHKPDFVDNIQREVSVHDLCRRSIAAKLKWSHAPPLLLASLERGQLEQMAPHVVSLMKGWNGRYHIMLEDIQFPQLEQLYFSLVDEVPESIRSHWISKIFSPSVFPNLKKLTVDLTAGAESVSEVLVLIWNTLPNLEEVSLCQESPGLLRDDAFIGLNGERPFLQLTKLKKLDLGLISNVEGTLTDKVFMEVIRYLGLHELYIRSSEPLKYITCKGISSLQQQPFIETIQKFPFNGWSLADLHSIDFRQLASIFPGNHEYL